MKGKCLMAAAAMLVAGALGGNDAENKIMTPRDLLDRGIVELIGRTIELKAIITWEYAAIKTPEDPRSADAVAKQAGDLKISFDGPGFEDVKARKAFRAEGEKIRKVAGADGREVYVLGDTTLVNGGEYILKVRILLRPPFNAKMLDNPVFVKQSNQPRYWAQTFSLHVEAARLPGDLPTSDSQSLSERVQAS